MKGSDSPQVILAIGFLARNQFIVVDEVGGQHLVHGVQVSLDYSCLHEAPGQCHVLLCRHRSSSSCQPTFLQRVSNNHDATRRALAHRPKPYSPKIIDEGPRGSILLIPSTLSTPYIRRDSGGPQKPFSSLSEGLRGIFTIITEAGEVTCVLLHILGPPCRRG